MFDIQTSPSHWTAERHFSQGVLGEPAVCPPNTNSGLSWDEKDGERDGRMEVCREEKMFSVSSTRGNWKNPCSPQRICSDAVNMLQTGPVPPTRHAKDWIVGGSTEQGSTE